MALNNAIRRGASRIVPLAIRASAGSQRHLHHHRNSALLAASANQPCRGLLQRPIPSLIHSYSSRPESDKSLLRVLESEIQCAVESNEAGEAEEVPQDFPFEIEDHPGQQTVTLRRKYQGEDITVEVHMPLLVDEENDADDDEEEEALREGQSSIPLIVRVSKGSSPSLEFGCTAYPDEIAIDSLSIKDPENADEQIAYEGPNFGDLDENLQKGFHKYLEMRGIKPSTTNFLHEYMGNKDNREYITWLKNLQKFVEG